MEILYWEFDSEKKKISFSERDLFKAKIRELIRTIQNTSATDPLLEEMARALEGYLNNDGARGHYWVIEKNKYMELCNQALQEYREMKDAK